METFFSFGTACCSGFCIRSQNHFIVRNQVRESFFQETVHSRLPFCHVNLVNFAAGVNKYLLRIFRICNNEVCTESQPLTKGLVLHEILCNMVKYSGNPFMEMSVQLSYAVKKPGDVDI